MKNTITFQGERTGVSSSGNVEWYEFTITTTRPITKKAALEIGNIHGMGGQTSSCEETKQDGIYTYNCKATCYCG